MVLSPWWPYACRQAPGGPDGHRAERLQMTGEEVADDGFQIALVS